ncbi:hypothetical protein IWW36_004578, partial [Coemansia brasiliensis]
MSEGIKYATPRSSTTALKEQEEMDTNLVEVDELARQGLLDGLEDLYDYSSDVERDSSRTKATTNENSMNNSIVESSTEVGELDDMDPAEAAKLVSQFGAFKPARASTDCAEPTRLQSSSSRTQLGQRQLIQGSADAKHNSEGEIDQLPDMSEIEAKKLVMSFGGFSRAHQASQKRPEEGKTAQRQQTGRAIIQRPGGTSRSSQSIEPHTPTRQQQLVGNATSPFPSRKDVLSARRALMGKSRGQNPAFASPRRVTITQPAPALQSLSARNLQHGATVGGARRQLPFKQPGRKRLSSGLQFKSPAKRVATVEPLQQKPKAAATDKTDTKTMRHRGLGAVEKLLDVGSKQQVPQAAREMTAEQAVTYRFPEGTGGWGAAEAGQALRAQGRDVADAW